MALQLRDGDDEYEHHDGVGDTVRHQGDEDGDRACGDGADDRDEAGEEGQDDQHERERHLQDEQADADEDGIDEGDHGLRADEAGEGYPGAAENLGEVVAPGRAGGTAHPGEELGAVFEEEEGEDKADHAGRDDLSGSGDAADHAGGDGVDLGACLVEEFVDGVVDLLGFDVQRRALDVVLQFVRAGEGLVVELLGLAGHRGRHGGEDAADDGEAAEHDGCDG